MLHQLVLGGASLRQKEEMGGRERERERVCLCVCIFVLVSACVSVCYQVYSNVIVTLGQLVLLISHRHLPCV